MKLNELYPGLEARILFLENRMNDLMTGLNGITDPDRFRNNGFSCARCGSVPYDQYVCTIPDCPHGCNPLDDEE